MSDVGSVPERAKARIAAGLPVNDYTWDAENRLIKQETRFQGASSIPGMPILRIEYKYDAWWRRVEKKVSTWNSTTNSFHLSKLTKFAYDGSNLIGEWEAEPTNLALVRTHHWGLDLSTTQRGAGGWAVLS
jgi:hypothetical protein